MQNPIIRNSLAVLAGLIVYNICNMGILNLMTHVIPPPEGMDQTSLESLKTSMSLLEAKHFVGPLLAHSIPVILAAYLTCRIAVSRHFMLAMIIGFVTFVAGLSMIIMMGGPTWFIILDLALYFPMAYLGYWLSKC